MWQYILRRLLWFIPTLLLISLFGFLLLVAAPGDPLDQLVPAMKAKDPISHRAQRLYWTKRLGLDLPVFYFSVRTLAEPDTLYRVTDANYLQAYRQLLRQSGNAETVRDYFYGIQVTAAVFNKPADQYPKAWRNIATALQHLSQTGDSVQIHQNILVLEQAQHLIGSRVPDLAGMIGSTYRQLAQRKALYKNYIPAMSWYGSNNRYHHWLFGDNGSKGVIRGDFGVSYSYKEPVFGIISQKMGWSLCFSVLSIVLAYLLSVPLGLRLARAPESRSNRMIRGMLLWLYTLPVFFVGVLLLMLFANPEVLPLLPPSGIMPVGGYAEGAGFLGKAAETLPYLILPLVCYTYASFAYITRLTSEAIAEQLPLDYIKTARAKGLDDNTILRKHALKNAVLPLITVFSTLFPALIGGSVIIETIFTIPGMGQETVHAIFAKDYPVVIAVLTLSCLLTMLSYLLADILYAWADPRIRYR